MNTEQIILEKFIQSHPVSVAKILEHYKIEDIVSLLNEIPQHLAVNVLNEFEPYSAIKCLEMLDPATSAALATKLPIQVISVFLSQISLELQESILSLMPKEVSIPLRKSIQYPPKSAGALADPFVPALPDDISVKEALQRVQNRKDRINHFIYIVNRNQVLCGVISLKELMFANSGSLLYEIMHKNVSVINADLNYQRILLHPGWQNAHVLPVVDENNLLLGMIRFKALKHADKKITANKGSEQIINTGKALGELYQISLAGLMKTAATLFNEQSEEKKIIKVNKLWNLKR